MTRRRTPARTGNGFNRAAIAALKITGVAALFGLVALGVAVMIALSSLPGYEEMRASPNGQMVRVLSRDGSVIASVGPRSEERRVGTECVSTCRSRWSTYHSNKKTRSRTKQHAQHTPT